MSKKTNKRRGNRERGLNIKIVAPAKFSKSGVVRVNNNFDKKYSSKRNAKTTKENTVLPQTASKKIDSKPDALKKATPVEKPESAKEKLKENVGIIKETPVAIENNPKNELNELANKEAREAEQQQEKTSQANAKPAEEPQANVKPAEEQKEEISPVEISQEEDSKEKRSQVSQEAIEQNAAKDTANKATQTEQTNVKLPASFSRDSSKSFADLDWAEPKPATEDKTKEPATDATNTLSSEAFNVLDETLKINTDATKNYHSKIIVRDVERFSPENETSLYRESIINKNFSIGSSDQEYQNVGLSASTMEEPPKMSLREAGQESSNTISAPNSQRSTESPKLKVSLPARELKEKEIKRAIKNASTLPSGKHGRKRFKARKFSWPRIVLAVSCMATAVFTIAYFINLSASDMSIKVAAMQSGIEASYPTYIPRGYSLSDVTSSNGKVVMRFKSGEGEYVLSEENSAWDSNALLTNFIEPEYGDDYTLVREQGLALYMGDRWEAWVNGGKFYKLTVTSGSLTKKQLKTIATSL